jgi:hypothetical protein
MSRGGSKEANVRISGFAALFAAMDVVPGLVLWALSPTDSVRIWYPTLLSYIGEHLFASTATFLLVWLFLSLISRRIRATDTKSGFSLTLAKAFGFGLTCLAVDVLASTELAFLQSRDSATIRLWHTQGLSGYLIAREPVYVAFGVVLLALATLRFLYQKRQTVVSAVPR